MIKVVGGAKLPPIQLATSSGSSLSSSNVKSILKTTPVTNEQVEELLNLLN